MVTEPTAYYFTNAGGNYLWANQENWNSEPDGSGITPQNIPWTDDGTGGAWYANADLIDATGGSTVVIGAGVVIDPNGVVTGSCDMIFNSTRGSIYGGTFTANYSHVGNTYGGTFTGGYIFAYGYSDTDPVYIYGGVFSGYVSGFGLDGLFLIYGGTFNGPVELNNYGQIYGGVFNSSFGNFSVYPYGGIYGGTFNGAVDNSYGGIYGGAFNGSVLLGSDYSFAQGVDFTNAAVTYYGGTITNCRFGTSFTADKIQGCYFTSNGVFEEAGKHYTYVGDSISIDYPASGGTRSEVSISQLLKLPFPINL